jgi:outer membrane protein OmpU
MKKVLFTTTALVAFAGAASAQVALSGYAEMGVWGGSGMETQFWNDFDVKFSLSGETDNGIAFGATIDLDEVSGGIGATSNPSSVFISGAFGTLTMGDTDGAFDKVMSETAVGTAIADDHSTHAGFSGNSGEDGAYDGQILRYDYSFGDFSVALSAEIDDTLNVVNAANTVYDDTVSYGDPIMGIGAKWSGDFGGTSVGIGLGYQDAPGHASIVGLSLNAGFAGGFGAGLNYSVSDSDIAGVADVVHTSVNVSYSANGLTVGANWGQFDTGAAATDSDGFGVIVNYDLGGGAVLMAGYGNGSVGTAADVNTFSFGLGLSF